MSCSAWEMKQILGVISSGLSMFHGIYCSWMSFEVHIGVEAEAGSEEIELCCLVSAPGFSLCPSLPGCVPGGWSLWMVSPGFLGLQVPLRFGREWQCGRREWAGVLLSCLPALFVSDFFCDGLKPWTSLTQHSSLHLLPTGWRRLTIPRWCPHTAHIFVIISLHWKVSLKP